MTKEQKIEKLTQARKEWQQKKDAAYNAFLYNQERIKKEIEKLQQELSSRQDEWQEQKQGFDAILFTYDVELREDIKDDPEQKTEESHDDSDKQENSRGFTSLLFFLFIAIYLQYNHLVLIPNYLPIY